MRPLFAALALAGVPLISFHIEEVAMKLIDDWRKELLRLWSMRVAAFWSLLCGLMLIWPGIAGSIPTWLYALGGVVISVSFSVARVLKQPGTRQ